MPKRSNTDQHFMRTIFGSISKTVLLFVAVWSSTTTFSQSLAILKQGENNFWVEASAPADNPHTLQTSENLQLWIDLQENVAERISISVTNSGLTQLFFRLAPSEPPAPPIRVMLIGDSMASRSEEHTSEL